MANQQHVEIVRAGKIRKWNDQNPTQPFDLSGHAFPARSFESAVLRGANMSGCDLSECNFRNANLDGANLAGCNLTRADFAGATLRGTNFTNANGFAVNFADVDMQNAVLDGCMFAEAKFERTDLTLVKAPAANFEQAHFIRARIVGANLRNAIFKRAQFENADLSDSNIREADFFEASFSKSVLGSLVGAGLANGLETTRVPTVDDVQYFESCKRSSVDKWFGWESLSKFGRFPLFGISYTTLILLYLYLQWVAFANDKVQRMNDTSSIAREYVARTDGVPASIKEEVVSRLKPIQLVRPDWIVWVVLVSNVFLAVASTIYALWCPERVKEFTKSRWCDEFRRPLIHYWPLAWSFPMCRAVCGITYYAGATGVVFVISWKVVIAAVLIAKTVPAPWQ